MARGDRQVEERASGRSQVEAERIAATPPPRVDIDFPGAGAKTPASLPPPVRARRIKGEIMRESGRKR